MVLSWPQVHRVAAREAARAHLELGIDTSRRVDPFVALEAEGVLVMRRPLHGVAGLYLPGNRVEGTRPGVLINVSHPVSKQRFTAAHELAHHRRDRDLILDEETDWIARGVAPELDRERIAESFASFFLMPRRLIEATLKSLGVRPNDLDAESAYALSLEFGTSYAATIQHLSAANMISLPQRRALLKVRPAEIKRALGGVDAMADSWRDIWRVRPPQPERLIGVHEGDAVWVELPEAPSSGYLWQPTSIPEGLSLVRDEYRGPGDDSVLGGSGFHRFLFRVETGGRRSVRMEMRRPWQRGVTAASERTVEFIAEPKPRPGIVQPRLLVEAGA